MKQYRVELFIDTADRDVANLFYGLPLSWVITEIELDATQRTVSEHNRRGVSPKMRIVPIG